MIYPDARKYAEDAPRCRLVPVALELRADYETPLSLFRKIGGKFLLESVEQSGQIGRYSILAVGEIARLTFGKDSVEIREGGATRRHEGRNPLHAVREWKKTLSFPDYGAKLPPFWGGFLGYLSYETVAWFENIAVRDEGRMVPEGIWVLPETMVIYDNARRTATAVLLTKPGADPVKTHRDACARLLELRDSLNGPRPPSSEESFTDEDENVEMPVKRGEFLAKVAQVKEAIAAGEIIQGVLSQPFRLRTRAKAFEIYRSLRILNPSPYLYFLDFDDFQIVGSSPEVMVKLEKGELTLKPIAGTRKRGATPAEDAQLAKELLADPKERAEHLMLVDLGRNDLGRISTSGSVEVSEYMTVERYSHVMHIVSTVRGRIRDDRDAFDVLEATFPAGTLTGAPKIRAMQILSELEPTGRGAYGGLVLALGLGGDLDSCITIRTAVVKDGVVQIQAGAGIVADSSAEAEYEETVNKAQAVIAAVRDARERARPVGEGSGPDARQPGGEP